MSQWGNTGYGQGYSQQQGQYSTDAQQVSQHSNQPSHTLTVHFRTSTAPRCLSRVNTDTQAAPAQPNRCVKPELRLSTDVLSSCCRSLTNLAWCTLCSLEVRMVTRVLPLNLLSSLRGMMQAPQATLLLTSSKGTAPAKQTILLHSRYFLTLYTQDKYCILRSPYITTNAYTLSKK